MAGFIDAKGSPNYLKMRFLKNVNAGEKLTGAEFEMSIEEYPNLSVLVRSAQIPAMGRADVEDFAGMGLKFMQHGALENSGEITVMATETITGAVISMLRDIVKNKKYVTVKFKATPESTVGVSAEAHKFKLEHVKIRSDVIDFATEDTAALVRPSMTLQYNWVDL